MPKFNFHFKDWKGFSDIPPKTKLLLLFLIGLLLLVIAIPTTKEPSAGDVTAKSSLDSDAKTADNSNTFLTSDEYTEYENLLERRIEDALEEVEGVGHVTAMITLKSSTESVIEKDTETDSSQGDGTTQSSSSKTSVYAQNSDGSQSPYVKKVFTPQIEGVMIIADGGDNSVVIQNISESVQALFGVEAHKIKIMKRSTT